MTMLIAIWVLCGVVAGAIGASRNVGFALHALIGFLFGPIGILTALLFKPTDEDKYRGKGDASGLTKCPDCAELVKVEARICKHCGGDLTIESANQNLTTGASVDTEFYRLYQIEIYPDHCIVEGKRFDTVDDAKKLIDHSTLVNDWPTHHASPFTRHRS